MKLSKQAGAAVVASMTLASSSSAVSVWEELLPRPTRKTKNVKKDSSSSSSIEAPITTDAEVLATSTPVFSPSSIVPESPSTIITTIPPHVSPEISSECCTTGKGCTDNDDCCSVFGPLCYKASELCCEGFCYLPIDRGICNPWVIHNSCIPATGPFYGNNTTTKVGLKYPFQTCYKYGNDGMNACYTQSWTDGAGYYYQCSPKDPYETFTYKVPWCGESCQELLPAFKECLAYHQICVDDDDCCEDSTCSVRRGTPWNEKYLCSPTKTECESWGHCWCLVWGGAFVCEPSCPCG